MQLEDELSVAPPDLLVTRVGRNVEHSVCASSTPRRLAIPIARAIICAGLCRSSTPCIWCFGYVCAPQRYSFLELAIRLKHELKGTSAGAEAHFK